MTDIRVAIAYLGFDTVRNLAVAIEAFQSLNESGTKVSPRVVEEIQLHSSSVAQLARNLIHEKNLAHDAFVAGLLHDFGRLVMASYFPEEFDQIRESSHVADVNTLEEQILGVSTVDLGAYVLRTWGLPNRLVDIVAFQHDAPRFAASGFDATHALYIAERLLAQRNDPEHFYWAAQGLDELTDEYLEELGIGDRVLSWRALHVGFGSSSRA